MNSLILIDSMDFGGAERQAVLDANGLVGCSYGVTLACFSPGPLVNELDDAVGFAHLNAPSWGGRIGQLLSLLRERRIEVVHAHMLRAELVGALAGWLGGCAVVLNEHGLGVRRSGLQRLAFRLAVSLAAEVWCASEATRRIRAAQDHVRADKLRVVHNGFAPLASSAGGEAQALRANLAARLGVDADNMVVAGYVGRFDPVKRLGLLVEMAARLRARPIVYVLVGDGVERQHVESAIRDHGMADRFHLPGFVHDPAGWYAAFDAFALASKRESLSMSLLEAASRGVPAVAFDVGGNAEVIVDGETGYLVSEGDLDAFTSRLAWLVDNPQTRRQLGANASNRMRARFSTAARLQVLTTSYASLAKGAA